jgi:hypothetical protein
MAYTDLYAQKGKSYMTIGTIHRENPLTDYNQVASIEKMVSKMKELPWPIYKVPTKTLQL